MRVPVDDLSIMVGLDGLTLLKHARAASLEELLTVGMAEAILCALEAERCTEKGQSDRLIN